MEDRNRYYMLWTLGSSALAILVFYFEFQAFYSAYQGDELKFVITRWNLRLTGTPALISHLANVGFGVLFLILAIDSYAKFRR